MIHYIGMTHIHRETDTPFVLKSASSSGDSTLRNLTTGELVRDDICNYALLDFTYDWNEQE